MGHAKGEVPMTGVTLLYITTSSPEEAQALGHTLVEERLAACANIIPGMRSVYWWEGKLETAAETVLILKTRDDLVSAATERVESLHSYACPCVLGLPVAAGSPAYVKWLLDETRSPFTEERKS
jgi:periplasmic divalent cation tolerance protein